MDVGGVQDRLMYVVYKLIEVILLGYSVYQHRDTGFSACLLTVGCLVSPAINFFHSLVSHHGVNKMNK